MDKKDICIATITWARNDAEENLLRESLQELAALNVPVTVTDGGSGARFLEFVKELPNTTIVAARQKGVQAQAQQSVQAAGETGRPFIFYTEPDKREFFKDFLRSFFEQVVAMEKAGIIMPSRSPQSFSTFPSFQQMTETTINNCCSEIVGQQLDYTYGPFVLNRQLLPHLSRDEKNIGWGWRPYLFIKAKQLGYRVDAIEGQFNCPPDQRVDDARERVYRMQQLEQNIRGIVLSAQTAPHEH